jgi:hypothetical protein
MRLNVMGHNHIQENAPRTSSAEPLAPIKTK